jgi:hypothetical protein
VTSGSDNFTMTALEVITFALQKINITATTEEPSADDASRAMRQLNMMLKGWQKYEQIWRKTEGYVNLVDDTAGYSLVPVPYRIIDARYRDADDNDTPMGEMTRQDYYELPDRASNGIPTQWVFDRQRATTSLYVWPVLLDATTESIRLTYQRRYEDVDALSDEIDVPTDYLEMVGYCLAARLADDFGKTGAAVDRIIMRAEQLLQEALDDDREDFLQLEPAGRYG